MFAFACIEIKAGVRTFVVFIHTAINLNTTILPVYFLSISAHIFSQTVHYEHDFSQSAIGAFSSQSQDTGSGEGRITVSVICTNAGSLSIKVTSTDTNWTYYDAILCVL